MNTPLIMLDGVEISIQELYDLDIYDIGQVTVSEGCFCGGVVRG